MTLYRRKGSKIWQYDFYKGKKRFQGSTGVKNRNAAQDIENTLKTDIAKAKFGLAPPKQSPPLVEFLEGAFLDHVDRHAKVKSTAKAYRERVKRLLRWPKWRDMPLSEIKVDTINSFIGFRKGLSVSGINAELSTLRKALNLGEEMGVCPRIKVRLLPGAKGRDFVVSPQLEAEYLEAAHYPLKQVALLMLDCGLRPEECVSLCKRDIDKESLRVRQGKTANAARIIPMTQRGIAVVELLSALFPDSPFLFKGYKDRHMSPKHITNLHEDLRNEKGWPREFCLYNFRHTFATRLAASGATPFDLMKIMGHSDIKMTARYIHPEQSSITLAMKRKEIMDKMLRGETPEESHLATTPL